MTITKARLDDAAFWHQHVCLGCAAIQSDDFTAGDPCEECGNELVLDAQLIRRCADFVEEESE
jgi:rRNA maturation endonuclease Nob1